MHDIALVNAIVPASCWTAGRKVYVEVGIGRSAKVAFSVLIGPERERHGEKR